MILTFYINLFIYHMRRRKISTCDVLHLWTIKYFWTLNFELWTWNMAWCVRQRVESAEETAAQTPSCTKTRTRTCKVLQHASWECEDDVTFLLLVTIGLTRLPTFLSDRKDGNVLTRATFPIVVLLSSTKAVLKIVSSKLENGTVIWDPYEAYDIDTRIHTNNRRDICHLRDY